MTDYLRSENGDLLDQRHKRRARGPAGLCRWCWGQRRETPGFAVDFRPDGGNGLNVLCAPCITRWRGVGFAVRLQLSETVDAAAFLEAVASRQAAIPERSALTLRRKEQ